MTFAEKLRTYRRQAGMSQEKLAEKLGVSRQAVTKWETDGGIPDMENILAISALFDCSIDHLLSHEAGGRRPGDFLFESVTEYDIDGPKGFDLKLGGASKLVLTGGPGEKLRVRLASNTLSTLRSDLKVKLDDIRQRLDLEVIRRNGLTEAAAKEAVTIFVSLPSPCPGKLEVAVNADTVELRDLTCEQVELDGKTRRVVLDGVAGTVEINSGLDMDILCRSLCGAVEVNQIGATSRLGVPEGTAFTAAAKGIGTSISYEREGARVEPFGAPGGENTIELNGLKSELVIYPLAAETQG